MPQFYLADGDNRKGPFSVEQLPAQGLTAQSLVWREGMADWLPAESVPELAPYLPRPQQQFTPQPQFNQPGYPHQPQYPQPNLQYQTPLPPQGGNGMAISSMVLGILALLLFWTLIIGIPLGVLAIIFGAISMKKHKGFALTGIICGAVSIVFALIIILIAAVNS